MCLHEYFQENCRYVSDCFRRLKYTYWATSHPNIMTPRPIQQKGPTFSGNCCLFSHFDPFFTFTSLNINIQSTLEAYYFKRALKGGFLNFSPNIFFQLSIQEILPCCGYLICSPDQGLQNSGSGFLKKCLKNFFFF